MDIVYLTGDATRPVDTGGRRYIAHVCNDAGGWGRGFVMALSDRWLEPELEYRFWAKSRQSRRQGGFELGGVQYVIVGETITVANMIAQHGYGGGPDIPLRYDALQTCLSQVGKEALREGATVHAPRIGTGLARGDWDRIVEIIRATEGPTIYVYDLPKEGVDGENFDV